jgi:hypothetical protein
LHRKISNIYTRSLEVHAKSEGRTELSSSEREQPQSHLDNIKQTKIEILNLKKEMIQAFECLKG